MQQRGAGVRITLTPRLSGSTFDGGGGRGSWPPAPKQRQALHGLASSLDRAHRVKAVALVVAVGMGWPAAQAVGSRGRGLALVVAIKAHRRHRHQSEARHCTDWPPA